MNEAVFNLLLILLGAAILLIISIEFGGIIALGTLITFVILFFYAKYRIDTNNSKAMEAWVAKKQEHADYLENIEKQRKKYYDELSDACFKIAEKHRYALVKNYSQIVNKDDYGVTIGLDKWEKELSHFFDNVLLADSSMYEKAFRCAELEKELKTARRKYMSAEELMATPETSSYDEDITILRAVVSDWIKTVAQEKIHNFREIDFETMSGAMFEIFCQETLENSGWSVVRKGGTGDQGVDLIAKREGLLVAIQCKRYSKPVGNKAVQEVEAGRQFEQAHRAAVVSTADYTPAARQLASSLGVLLLHHEDLERLHEVITP